MSTGTPTHTKGLSWYFWSRTNPLDTEGPESLFAAPIPYTIFQVKHRVRSALSDATLLFDLRHGPTVATGGGTLVFTGTSDNLETVETVFGSADIPADDIVWVDLTTLTDGPAEEWLIQVEIL